MNTNRVTTKTGLFYLVAVCLCLPLIGQNSGDVPGQSAA